MEVDTSGDIFRGPPRVIDRKRGGEREKEREEEVQSGVERDFKMDLKYPVFLSCISFLGTGRKKYLCKEFFYEYDVRTYVFLIE